MTSTEPNDRTRRLAPREADVLKAADSRPGKMDRGGEEKQKVGASYLWVGEWEDPPSEGPDEFGPDLFVRPTKKKKLMGTAESKLGTSAPEGAVNTAIDADATSTGRPHVSAFIKRGKRSVRNPAALKAKRDEQALKNREMSKTSRIRKEKRFQLLEAEISRLQDDQQRVTALNESSSDTKARAAYDLLLAHHDFWNRHTGRAETHVIPSNAVIHRDGLVFLPSKTLDKRDGSKKRPFVSPVWLSNLRMQRNQWKSKLKKKCSSESADSTDMLYCKVLNRSIQDLLTSMKEEMTFLTLLSLGKKECTGGKREAASADTAAMATASSEDKTMPLLQDLFHTLQLTEKQVEDFHRLKDEAISELSRMKVIEDCHSALDDHLEHVYPAIRGMEQKMFGLLPDSKMNALLKLTQANIDLIGFLDLGGNGNTT